VTSSENRPTVLTPNDTEPDKWVQSGIRILVRESIENVEIPRIAETLGVTEQEVLAHYDDQHALREAILLRWFYKTTTGIIDRANREGTTPRERLRRLLELPFWSSKISLASDLELAIRDWARRSEHVRDLARRADDRRLQFLQSLFLEMGLDEGHAKIRAHSAYAHVRYFTQNCHLGETVLRQLIDAAMVDLSRY
jgi:AcrR family transcriptional regulator